MSQEPMQAQLVASSDAAFRFYEQVAGGSRPTVKQTQALLALAGVPVSLERMKARGDLVRESETREAAQEGGAAWPPQDTLAFTEEEGD